MDKKTETEKNEEIIKKHQDDKAHVKQAHDQADKDIAKDADLSIHSPNDDLDEGELANLGGDKNDLV